MFWIHLKSKQDFPSFATCCLSYSWAVASSCDKSFFLGFSVPCQVFRGSVLCILHLCRLQGSCSGLFDVCVRTGEMQNGQLLFSPMTTAYWSIEGYPESPKPTHRTHRHTQKCKCLLGVREQYKASVRVFDREHRSDFILVQSINLPCLRQTHMQR